MQHTIDSSPISLKNRLWLQPFLLVMTGVVAYFTSLDCSFHFDDFSNITGNPAIREVTGQYGWLTFNPRRWVGFLSFALNYQVNGFDVTGYHLVNLAIHLVNSLLVWRLLCLIFITDVIQKSWLNRYKTEIPFFTAWLFTVHPVMTEAVTYIVQRFVILSSFFYLLALVFFLQAMMHRRRGFRILFFTGTFLSALLSFFTKETAYTLPLLLFLTWFFFIRKPAANERDKRYPGYMVSGVILIMITLAGYAFLSGNYFTVIPPREGRPYAITPIAFYCTELPVMITYLRLILLPVNQTFDYNYPLYHSPGEAVPLLSMGILVLILTVAMLFYRRQRLVSFGIVWFFIIMAPQALVPRPNVIFEHRIYLSVLGILLIWVMLLFFLVGKIRLPGRISGFSGMYFRNMATVFLLFQAVLFTWMTWQRNRVWENEFTLWSDCLKKAPGSARSWINLGCALHQRKDFRKAIVHFDQAIRIFPDYLQAYNNRGASYMALQDYELAVRDFTRVIGLNPRFLESWANRGIAQRKMHRFEAAIHDFSQAIRLDTTRADLFLQRGITYRMAGINDSAFMDINKATALGSKPAKEYLRRSLTPN